MEKIIEALEMARKYNVEISMTTLYYAHTEKFGTYLFGQSTRTVSDNTKKMGRTFYADEIGIDGIVDEIMKMVHDVFDLELEEIVRTF